MTSAYADAVAALPERVQARLAGPVEAAGVAPSEPVAFAGHVLRLGERGLLVLGERELVFAAETGRVDRVPYDRLTRAVPRESLLAVAPGTGGRVEDEYRPLQPPSFGAVEWPRGIAAVHPDAGPRAPQRGAGRLIAVVLVLLLVAAAVAALLLA